MYAVIYIYEKNVIILSSKKPYINGLIILLR